MTHDHRVDENEYLTPFRDELRAAKAEGDEPRICLALSRLGAARFRLDDYVAGSGSFVEAKRRAEEAGDLQLWVACLGIQILAHQEINRHHDAYEIAEEVRQRCVEEGDHALTCRALLNQGQILLDSGEPMLAVEKLQEAREIAAELGDRTLEMTAAGALGNQALEVTAAGEAESYFVEALDMARVLGDVEAEYGYLGNLALIYGWQEKYQQAFDALLPVLAHVRETGNSALQLRTLQALVNACLKLERSEDVAQFAGEAIKLANELGRFDLLLELYEAAILASYRLDRLAEAESITNDALALARASGDDAKETDLLLSLGESYMLSGLYDQALSAYGGALTGAAEQGREWDEAYLTGRMGVALAELERVDEAMDYHRRAIELARARQIPALEGEQLTMLAFAYLQLDDRRRARYNLFEAIEVLAAAGLDEDVANARKLLAEIGTSEPAVVA